MNLSLKKAEKEVSMLQLEVNRYNNMCGDNAQDFEKEKRKTQEFAEIIRGKEEEMKQIK